MSHGSRDRRKARRIALTFAGLAMLISGPALAQAAAETVAAAPSESAMVNLVGLLVKQGVLTRANGDALIAQALSEAENARTARAPAQQAQAELPAAPAGTMRVPYVPQTVRDQIRDEIRTEVLAQARTEGWASPQSAAPDWTRRIRLYGDVRVRSESDLYAKTNSNLIEDFGRLTQDGPVDIRVPGGLNFLNSTVDQVNRLRYRARLGIDAQVNKYVTAGIRLASGDNNGPISTTASLGGGFSKRDIYIDRAFLTVRPTPWADVNFGRFANPFTTSELLFDEDLNLDGVAAEARLGKFINDDVSLTVRGGAFPLDFGDDDFPASNPTKSKAPNKYLFSGQIEAGFKFDNRIQVNASVAYYDFENVQGQLSTGCQTETGIPQCSTDYSRPFFSRKGNTLFGLRQITSQSGTAPLGSNLQIYGLSFNYRVLDVMGSVTVPVTDKIGVTLMGDYVRNLAFHRSDVCRNGLIGEPINNNTNRNGDTCGTSPTSSFTGGGTGYFVQAKFGHPRVEHAGEWSTWAGYRYVQTDAVLDSLTDSDFHFGGTNAKGYIIGGNYGLLDNISLGARWLSANEIVGDPFAIDVLQVDLAVKF